MKILLSIDIGTSACKTIAFDPEGTVLASETVAYATDYPHPDWAQQNPDDWWQATCSAIRRITAVVDPSSIACVGIDGQSWSAVAVDAEGRVLCPTPIWTDTRSRQECEDMRRLMPEEDWFQLDMNPLQPGYTLPKILWYRRHLPDVYQKTRWILQSNSFIVYRLTGQATQDLSQGYGLHCFRMRSGTWDLESLEKLGIPASLLPELLPSSAIAGQVTPAAAADTGLLPGTPVIAGGLDAACATLGVGVIHPGETQEQGGQSGGMSLCVDQCTGDPRLILGYHVVPGQWLLQGGTTGGGGALKWLRQTICPELSFEEMSDLAQTVAPGSDGLLFLPYLRGERSPLWNPDAKGVFFGLTYTHTRAHMIRAVLEGVAFALEHNLRVAAEAGAEVSEMNAMGGASNSALWTQIKADVTGKVIHVPGSDTATTLGAAILAGVGSGIYGSYREAVERTVSVRKTYTPDPEKHAVYQKNMELYLALYRNLESIFSDFS